MVPPPYLHSIRISRGARPNPPPRPTHLLPLHFVAAFSSPRHARPELPLSRRPELPSRRRPASSAHKPANAHPTFIITSMAAGAAHHSAAMELRSVDLVGVLRLPPPPCTPPSPPMELLSARHVMAEHRPPCKLLPFLHPRAPQARLRPPSSSESPSSSTEPPAPCISLRGSSSSTLSRTSPDLLASYLHDACTLPPLVAMATATVASPLLPPARRRYPPLPPPRSSPPAFILSPFHNANTTPPCHDSTIRRPPPCPTDRVAPMVPLPVGSGLPDPTRSSDARPGSTVASHLQLPPACGDDDVELSRHVIVPLLPPIKGRDLHGWKLSSIPARKLG